MAVLFGLLFLAALTHSDFLSIQLARPRVRNLKGASAVEQLGSTCLFICGIFSMRSIFLWATLRIFLKWGIFFFQCLYFHMDVRMPA